MHRLREDSPRRFQAFDLYGIPWRLQTSPKLRKLESSLKDLCSEICEKHPAAVPLDWIPSLRRKLLKLAPRYPRRRESLRQAGIVQAKRWVDRYPGASARVENLPKLHAQLLGRKAPLQFRIKPAYLVEHSGKREWTYPPSNSVPDLWTDLLHWQSDCGFPKKLGSGFGFSFGLHLIVISIHPFADGNGRAARMLAYANLRRLNGPLARLIHPETIVHWDFKNYFRAIDAAREDRSLNPFVEHLMESYALSAESLLSK